MRARPLDVAKRRQTGMGWAKQIRGGGRSIERMRVGDTNQRGGRMRGVGVEECMPGHLTSPSDIKWGWGGRNESEGVEGALNKCGWVKQTRGAAK